MDKGVDALPTVMTCTKYLKLPEYSSFELLQHKLIQAIQYGRDRFEMT
jgi:E3 ubiquitin-protein ligase TRIP12